MSRIWQHRLIPVVVFIVMAARSVAAQETRLGVDAAVTAQGVAVEFRGDKVAVGTSAATTSESRPRALVPLYFSFGALQAYDMHSTLRAIDRGAREVNP